MTGRVVEDLPARADPAGLAWDTFVSYRHVDRAAAHALAHGLAARGLVVFFDERGIHLGADWEQVIGVVLDVTRSCVVVVSPTGVGGVQAEEVARALERQAADPDFPVVPVLLPNARREGPLAAYLDDRSHLRIGATATDEDLDRIAGAIRGLGLELPTGPPRPNPYPGLRPFDEADAADFHGRDDDVRALVDRVRTAGLVSIVGPSGTGKSSLLLAGLLPALRSAAAGAAPPDVVVVRPGAHPRQAVSAALGRPDDARSFAELVALRAADGAGVGRLVVAIDQLEEVVTRCRDERERRWLLDGLTAAAAGGADAGAPVVVVTVRSDHLGRLNEHAPFGTALARSTYLLGPLTDDGVRDAVRRPAWRQAVGFQPGLVEEMLEDLRGQPNPLPLLAVTLAEMWDRRRGDRLTIETYQAVGRVGGALSQRADAVVAGVATATVERTLGRLVDIGPDGTAVRRRRSRDDVVPADPLAAAGVDALLADLVAARLVVAADDDGTPTYELAHDTLLAGWDRLARLVRDRRSAIELRGRLSDAADDWQRAGRTDDAVLRGAELVTVEEGVRRGDVTPTAVERELLDASRAVVRRTRRRVAWVVALAACTVAAIVAGLVVNERGQRSARERDVARAELRGAEADRAAAQEARAAAEADRAAARRAEDDADRARAAATDDAAAAVVEREAATAVLSGDRATGIRQALLAADRRTSAVTRQAVAAAATRSPQPSRIRSFGVFDRAVHDPSGDGRSILLARPDGRIDRCAAEDPAGCTAVLRPGTPGAATNEVGVGASGRAVLLASDEAVESPGLRTVVPGASAVAVTPAGDAVLVGTADGRVERHPVDGGPAATLATDAGRVRALAVDPAGTTVAVAGDGGPGALLVPIGGGVGRRVGTTPVTAVALTDRFLVLADSGTADVLVWRRDALDATPVRLSGHPATVTVLSTRGETVVSGDTSGVVRRWDLDRARPVGAVLTPDASPAASAEGSAVLAAGTTADGAAVVVAHLDGTVVTWPADDRAVALDRRVVGDAAAPVPTAAGWLAVAPTVVVDGGGRVPLAGATPVLAAGTTGDALLVVRTDAVTLVDRVSGVERWRAATGAPYTSAAVDGATAVVGTATGEVLVLDDTGAVRTRAGAPGDRPVATVAVTADGARVAYALAGAREVVVAEADGATVRLVGHRNAVTALAFSPDGGRLASGGDDRDVLVHDLASDPPSEPLRLVGHTDKVTSVLFVPGSDLLVSGGEDGTMRLWTDAGDQLGRAVRVGGDRVVGLVAHPDRAEVAGAAGGDVVVLALSGWEARLCSVIGPAPAGAADPCG